MSPRGAHVSRLQTAVFTPIGDEGRAMLVEQRIAGAISSGALSDGEKLPSESELARSLGVAVVTVREALISLRHQGLVTTRRGRNGGSFVTAPREAAEAQNARTLQAMSRVALNDLSWHYETIAMACAEFACRRATTAELEVLLGLLAEANAQEQGEWRRRITEAQLELAGLSQSVRLTKEHVRLQAEFTPLLSLQDGDPLARQATHDALVAQVQATLDRNVPGARAIVKESVRGSVRWLMRFRAALPGDANNQDVETALADRGALRLSQPPLSGGTETWGRQ